MINSLLQEARTAFQDRFDAGVVLSGRISAHDTARHLSQVDLGGATFEVPQTGLNVGDPVRLRIRARDVSLALSRPAGLSIRNMAEVSIRRIEPGDGSAFAEIVLDLGGQKLRARLTRAAVEDLALAPGQQVVALVKAVSFDRQALA